MATNQEQVDTSNNFPDNPSNKADSSDNSSEGSNISLIMAKELTNLQYFTPQDRNTQENVAGALETYISSGLKGQTIIDAIYDDIAPEDFISASLIKSRFFYHSFKAKLMDNGVKINFPE